MLLSVQSCHLLVGTCTFALQPVCCVPIVCCGTDYTSHLRVDITPKHFDVVAHLLGKQNIGKVK